MVKYCKKGYIRKMPETLKETVRIGQNTKKIPLSIIPALYILLS